MVVCSLDRRVPRLYLFVYTYTVPYLSMATHIPISSSRLSSFSLSTHMHSTRAVYMYQIAAAVIGPRRTLHVPAVACPLLFPPIVHGTRGHDELNVLIPYTVYVMDGSHDHPPQV
jgi:hypothetical protein